MRRSGFTMVELIFVIVIIGILAATALPKFSGVRDKAKVNSELAALSGLDGAITAASEFRYEDYNDRNVSWHDSGLGNNKDTFYNKYNTIYPNINSSRSVLKGIAKKTENLKIIGLLASENNGTIYTTGEGPHPDTYDILFITGPASDAQNGVMVKQDIPGGDILGKPDKNDVWVFNPNSFDLNVTSTNLDLHESPVIIPAQSIGLIDVNGTTAMDVTKLSVVATSGGTGKAPHKVQ